MGGLWERFGRDSEDPSHPETPLNTGVSEENVRDEGFYNLSCIILTGPKSPEGIS